MKRANRVSKIKPSPTLAVTTKAKKMKSEGIDVIGFGAGEPDFDTPTNIKDTTKKAVDEGFTKYTPINGIDELKFFVINPLVHFMHFKISPNTMGFHMEMEVPR